jgi:hypothetical protein
MLTEDLRGFPQSVRYDGIVSGSDVIPTIRHYACGVTVKRKFFIFLFGDALSNQIL